MHLINEDWERESLKDLVYLCEQQDLLLQELREEAIIYSSLEKTSQDADKQVAKVCTITSEGLQSGSDVHADSDKEWK